MLGYGRDESVPYALRGVSQPISWVFCVYFVGERCIIATRQQCCCNAFRIHSRSVRNVFVICVLHIRRVKVWFLFFECCVVAICLECYHNPFAAEWQSVRNVLAIRQPCFGNPSAMFWQTVSHVLANRSQCFGKPFAIFWQSVRNVLANRQQPQGGDLSCPHI